MNVCNSVVLIGRVVGAPRYFTTENGADLTKFELRCLQSGDWSTTPYESALHHCYAFGPAALLLHEYLSQDSPIAIRGELRYTILPDREGLAGDRVAEILIQDFTFL